jgi:dTDP-4-amino-4,6-dideoxygalactose transaminase
MSYRIYLSPPHLQGNEQRYLLDAISSNWISSVGPAISAFENALSALHTPFTSALCSSGTAAIHLALKALNVERGDFVLCSSFTFAGSTFPIQYVNAIPVLIDSEPDTWNMDPALLEQAIRGCLDKGKKPKALILVQLYGHIGRMNEILTIAKNYEIPVIEDAAEALGSELNGQRAGAFGTIGILSFNGNKIITTSGGGSILCQDKALLDKMRFWANQSREEAVHYEHLETGYNYRMSNLLAAVGNAQLEQLPEKISLKRALFERYRTNIHGADFHREQEGEKNNRWLSCALLQQHDPFALVSLFHSKGIEVRPLWKPMHLQPVFENCPAYLNGTSEHYFKRGICLPSGTSLQEDEQDEIIRIFNSYVE